MTTTYAVALTHDSAVEPRDRCPHRRRRADRPGAGPVADAPRRASSHRRQDRGAGDDVARARRAGTHARALSPGRSRGRGRRARTPDGRHQSLGRPAGRSRTPFWRHGRGHQPVSLRADLSAGRARAAADRSACARPASRSSGRRRSLEFEETEGRRAWPDSKRAMAPTETCEAAYIAGCDGAHSTVAADAGHRLSGRHLRASLLRGRRRTRGPGDERRAARRPGHAAISSRSFR